MAQKNDYKGAVKAAKEYYDSNDAHNFYYRIWGGEDLHLGIYKTRDEDIFTASRRTIDRMASYADKIDENTKIIDIGGGFSGSARYLAKKFGCHVTVLNLSETENQRGRKMNKEQGLDHLIDVIDGSFENIPFPDASFDIVWSEDAILHSEDRKKVVEEVSRVLKPDGEFIFTDPMQSNDCNEEELKPIYERINLSTLGSPKFYRDAATEFGLKEEHFEDLSDQLPLHYGRVKEELEKNEHKIEGYVSREYRENMKRGLQNWVNGGEQGNLVWGIFHFRKTS